MALSNSIPLPDNAQDSNDPEPEFDFPIKRRILRSEGFRSSENTPIKQQSYEAAIDLSAVLHKAIKASQEKKYPGMRVPPYCYIDLNAGRGQDEDGNDGSPLIFKRTADNHRIRHEAHFYECDNDNAQTLQHHLMQRGYSPSEVHNQDHNVLLKTMLPLNKWQFGLIYADPSNATPAWDVLNAVVKKASRIDILINIACASYKRQIELPHYVRLDQRILDLKEYWFVRKPLTNFQWSMLFGTNWNKYPGEIEDADFCSIETEPGRTWFETMVLTRREIDAGDQLVLL